MSAKMTADYSQFPESIRDAMPYVEGEVVDLRHYWGIFNNLFVGNPKRLQLFAEYLGPMLGVFQQLLQSHLILMIGRLTDKAKKNQRNLSLRSLTPAIKFAKDKEFGPKVNAALKVIDAAVAKVRTHRHKHVAHSEAAAIFDMASLPKITPNDLRSILEQMEAFLNIFQMEFRNAIVSYDELLPDQIINRTQLTVYKAKAYDLLEAQGTIPYGRVEKIAETLEDQ